MTADFLDGGGGVEKNTINLIWRLNSRSLITNKLFNEMIPYISNSYAIGLNVGDSFSTLFRNHIRDNVR